MGELDTRIDRPIGRDREVALILDELDRGRDTYITGPAGVGKSMVLREVRRRLAAEGVQVIAISGMEATALVPLAPLLRFCPPGADDAGAAIISELYRLSRSSDVVVMVDDAHLLDHATAAIVRQMAGVDVAGLVVAHRDGEDVPEAIQSILDEGLATHARLDPLDRASTAELTERILGATEDRTIDWIWDHGQGNPLYTRELITAGTQTGALQVREGRWLAVDAPIWTSRLHSLVARRLADMTPAERSCLQTIAVAGRLHMDVLGDFFDLDVIFDLEKRNLVRIEERTVEVDHPLYGTALLATMTAKQTGEVSLRLADALQDSDEHADPVVIATLRLDAGADVGESLLRAAMRAARDSRLPERAERFGRRLLDLGDDPEVRMHLCEALAIQERWDEAEQEYKAAVAISERALHSALLERWVNINFEFREDLAETEQIVQQAIPEIGSSGSEGWQLTMLRLGLFTDNLDTALEGHSAWLADHPHSALRTIAHVGVATAASHNGAFAIGLEASRDMGRPSGVDPVEQMRMDGVTLQNHAWLHGLEASRQLIATTLQRDVVSGDPERELLAEFYCGMVKNDLTCPVDALPHLRRTVAMQVYARRRRANPVLPGELARATAGIVGGEAEAQQWLKELYGFPPELLWLAQPLGKLAEATLAHRRAQDPLPTIEEGLDHARRRSARIHEVPLLRLLAELGKADDVRHRLEELSKYMGGGFAELVAREAAGLADGDPEVLDDLAAEAWRFGSLGLAADSAAWAAGLHVSRGEMRAALLAQMRSDAIVGDRPVRTIARDGLERVMSEREQQVVEAVASGHSNREVATRLYISHRTVESHLRRVYRRFGIDGREELSLLLSQAVTQPSASNPSGSPTSDDGTAQPGMR